MPPIEGGWLGPPHTATVTLTTRSRERRSTCYAALARDSAEADGLALPPYAHADQHCSPLALSRAVVYERDCGKSGVDRLIFVAADRATDRVAVRLRVCLEGLIAAETGAAESGTAD